VHTPERDLCAPTGRTGKSGKNARRIAATASIAAAGMFGATVGSTPAVAGGPPTEPPASPAPATALTPVAKLVSNHTTVNPGQQVSFTVTERSPGGNAVADAHATFYVHAKAGWKKVTTKTLSSAGSATFTFKPNYTHAYRVDLASLTDGTTVYTAADTSNVTVKTDIGAALVATAAKQKGKPYHFGADGPGSFDCSGLTKYVFSKFGITLPHLANSQRSHGTKVSRKNAKPGDLVFVMSGSHATHVAIYAGNGMWWEAPHTGASVRKVKIWSSHVEFRHVR
jgi:cell wall-associated NlpC family hydrolase